MKKRFQEMKEREERERREKAEKQMERSMRIEKEAAKMPPSHQLAIYQTQTPQIPSTQLQIPKFKQVITDYVIGDFPEKSGSVNRKRNHRTLTKMEEEQ